MCPLAKQGDMRNRPNPSLEATILQHLSKIQDAKHVIAEYYDSFAENEKFYLVMEMCKHGSIYDYLNRERKRPFTEDQSLFLNCNYQFLGILARDILLAILMALDLIHTAGYLHRDLSPKNILIHSFNAESVPQIVSPTL
jgi:serine/threonine protein kinase